MTDTIDIYSGLWLIQCWFIVNNPGEWDGNTDEMK